MCRILSQNEGIYNVKKGPHQGAPSTFLQKTAEKAIIIALTAYHPRFWKQISPLPPAEMRFLHP